MYRLTSAALAAVVSLAAVSMATAQTTPSSPPASTSQGAPMPGANSFTEAQAKDRMEKAGFSQVNSLKKDDQGIWRASALSTWPR